MAANKMRTLLTMLGIIIGIASGGIDRGGGRRLSWCWLISAPSALIPLMRLSEERFLVTTNRSISRR